MPDMPELIPQVNDDNHDEKGSGSTSEEDAPGIPKPKPQDHKGGMGPPLDSHWGGNHRAFHDGCGLCSPGRWHPSRRKSYVWTGIARLRSKWLSILSSHVPDIKRLVFQMACGKVLTNPFSDEMTLEARQFWAETIFESRRDPPFTVPELLHVPEFQPFLLRCLSETLRLMRDPDWRIMCTDPKGNFEEGVPIGVGFKLPRTPAVYERKTKWKKLDETDFVQDMSNYKSAAGEKMSEILRKQFQEEADLGMMYETTLEQAQLDFPGDLLRVAAQGAIEKTDETFRIVHDGTHGVRVNNDIRVRDQTKMPGAHEARKIMDLCYVERNGVHFQLLMDARKAHRRYLHRKIDHGLQACRSETSDPLDDPKCSIWINRTGTFGVGCAGYWWGRLAACCGRIALAFIRNGEWFFQLVYADDTRTQAYGPDCYSLLLLNLFAWHVFGTPITWKKLRGGLAVDWIGFYLDYTRFEIGISESRAMWLQRWGDRVVSDGMVHMQSMAEGLGRLGFASGVIEWCKPFLSPIYSWVSAAPSHAILVVPPLVKLTLTWIIAQLKEGRRTTPCRGPMEDMARSFARTQRLRRTMCGSVDGKVIPATPGHLDGSASPSPRPKRRGCLSAVTVVAPFPAQN